MKVLVFYSCHGWTGAGNDPKTSNRVMEHTFPSPHQKQFDAKKTSVWIEAAARKKESLSREGDAQSVSLGLLPASFFLVLQLSFWLLKFSERNSLCICCVPPKFHNCPSRGSITPETRHHVSSSPKNMLNTAKYEHSASVPRDTRQSLKSVYLPVSLSLFYSSLHTHTHTRTHAHAHTHTHTHTRTHTHTHTPSS